MKFSFQVEKPGLLALVLIIASLCGAFVYHTYKESAIRQVLAENAKPMAFQDPNERIIFNDEPIVKKRKR